MDTSELIHTVVDPVFEPLTYLLLGAEGHTGFTRHDPYQDSGGLWNPINQYAAARDYVVGTPEDHDSRGEHPATPGLFDGMF